MLKPNCFGWGVNDSLSRSKKSDLKTFAMKFNNDIGLWLIGYLLSTWFRNHDHGWVFPCSSLLGYLTHICMGIGYPSGVPDWISVSCAVIGWLPARSDWLVFGCQHALIGWCSFIGSYLNIYKEANSMFTKEASTDRLHLLVVACEEANRRSSGEANM